MTMTELSLTIRLENPSDHHAIDKLHERAFGPGRYARTAYRLREGVAHEADLSFTALVGTLVVGSIRMTRIVAGEVPALLLGPLTVEPAFEKRGIGFALSQRALDAARAAGHRLVILVGDEPYYARLGFRRVPAGRLGMPGPVDVNRLLYLELADDAFAPAAGPIRQANPSATA